MHFDAAGDGVPYREVLKILQIKIGGKLTVEALQNILIECGGHALVVGIRGDQNVGGLGQIHADDESGALPQYGSGVAQKLNGLFRLEVADRRAWKETDDR